MKLTFIIIIFSQLAINFLNPCDKGLKQLNKCIERSILDFRDNNKEEINKASIKLGSQYRLKLLELINQKYIIDTLNKSWVF